MARRRRDERHLRGPVFGVSRAERQLREGDARAKKLAGQFIMTCTPTSSGGPRIQTSWPGKARGKAGWNPALADKEQTID